MTLILKYCMATVRLQSFLLSTRIINQLTRLNTAGTADDVNIVAGLLKLFLRELPSPLLPSSVVSGIAAGLCFGCVFEFIAT